MLYEVITLGSVTINSAMSSKEKKSSQNLSVDYNGNKLVSLNTAVDMETNNAYINVPELSEAYLSVNPEDLAPFLEKQGVSLDSLLEMYGVSDVSSLLTGDVNMDLGRITSYNVCYTKLLRFFIRLKDLLSTRELQWRT